MANQMAVLNEWLARMWTREHLKAKVTALENHLELSLVTHSWKDC
jgi:hypothetical protein